MPQTVSAQDAPSQSASGQGVHNAIVIDLRPGENDVRAPSREAFRDALGEFGEIALTGDVELRHTLARSTYSPLLEEGRLALAAATLAYGAQDCPGVVTRSDKAILDFAAADAAGVKTEAERYQVYLLRFLCADRTGDLAAAERAAAMLRVSTDGERPKEISETTWQRYLPPDEVRPDEVRPNEASSEASFEVRFESLPAGARVRVDFEDRGKSPARVALRTGEHVVGMGTANAAVSQKITVRGPGTVQLSLHTIPKRWEGLRDATGELRKATGPARVEGMSRIMAAVPAEIAFVMRDPGRVSVWILRENHRAPEHVGYAPSAAIAGALALQELRAPRTAGLDPTMPLLREVDEETTAKKNTGPRWWIYGGAVLGAAIVGAGLIIAQDFTDDYQRIEVTFP